MPFFFSAAFKVWLLDDRCKPRRSRGRVGKPRISFEYSQGWHVGTARGGQVEAWNAGSHASGYALVGTGGDRQASRRQVIVASSVGLVVDEDAVGTYMGKRRGQIVLQEVAGALSKSAPTPSEMLCPKRIDGCCHCKGKN